MAVVYTYLTMTAGPQVGANFVLDERKENHIGRISECAIVLLDPACSRVHAVIRKTDRHWHVRDANSRNGTYVNGQKIDEAMLDIGHSIRIGTTELLLQMAERPPSTRLTENFNVKQTVIQEAKVADQDVLRQSRAALTNPESGQDLVAMHALSVNLLGCNDPQAVMQATLDTLHERIQASAVGYLLVDEEGLLRPAEIKPADSNRATALNDQLTRRVCEEQRAIWISNTPLDLDPLESRPYSDAFCVPLVVDHKVLGAIHAYLDSGRFRKHQFDFAIGLANITALALDRALYERRLSHDFQRLKEASPGYDTLIGNSPPMLDLQEKIGRLARTSGCVLIRGESGTGKELIARAVHRASLRAERPLLAVNCAAIPSELMDSQLFGHKAGSFTSADRDHIGYFQQADLGTLFLDEIGELSLLGQSKLLRILEGHPFLPVGGTQEIRVDVRVIAATNRDLLGYVREKKFREDLYYRLCVFELISPPLRERRGDVDLLVDYFLEHFRRLHSRPQLKLSNEARDMLRTYDWPGNVRQLRNAIDSAVVLARGNVIETRDLGLRPRAAGEDLSSLRIDDWEKKLIAEAMKRAHDNVPEAARLLGISRATLYRKLDEYGLRRS